MSRPASMVHVFSFAMFFQLLRVSECLWTEEVDLAGSNQIINLTLATSSTVKDQSQVITRSVATKEVDLANSSQMEDLILSESVLTNELALAESTEPNVGFMKRWFGFGRNKDDCAKHRRDVRYKCVKVCTQSGPCLTNRITMLYLAFWTAVSTSFMGVHVFSISGRISEVLAALEAKKADVGGVPAKVGVGDSYAHWCVVKTVSHDAVAHFVNVFKTKYANIIWALSLQSILSGTTIKGLSSGYIGSGAFGTIIPELINHVNALSGGGPIAAVIALMLANPTKFNIDTVGDALLQKIVQKADAQTVKAVLRQDDKGDSCIQLRRKLPCEPGARNEHFQIKHPEKCPVSELVVGPDDTVVTTKMLAKFTAFLYADGLKPMTYTDKMLTQAQLEQFEAGVKEADEKIEQENGEAIAAETDSPLTVDGALNDE